ncbi:MAG: hypothetical protein BMS9Abin13_453 [Patescibacteria group bacterium]|nr:MAG: hypothetical protein BMS9Abin13_453 [Patescibacteria group bacterium]
MNRMKNIPILKSIFVGVARLVTGRIKIILLLIFIGALVWFAFDYIEAKKQVALLSNPVAQQEAYQKEIREIVKQVSKLIILPEGSPDLATIQDATALAAQQPFFKDAENGDKILIYKDKAIIFSPTKNMLVNVGPVYAEESQTPPAPAPVSQEIPEEEEE